MRGSKRRNRGCPDVPDGPPTRMPPGQMPPPAWRYPPGWYTGQFYPHPMHPSPPVDGRASALRRIGLAGAGAFLLIPFVILLTILMLLVFVGKPYIVHGQSMLATLHDGDRVFVVPYRGNTTPDRDDVVVLKDIAGSPEMLIKRVVAITGDRVTIEDGYVVVNGTYRHRSTNRHVPVPYTQLVPDGDVFVMGDNEAHSFDSRTFGPVPGGKVVGKALLIFWPPGDWKKL